MSGESRISRDFEIPFVRWWLRQRFLLLATVFLLLLALGTTVIGALWITRVKEEIPAELVVWQPEQGEAVFSVREADRGRFEPGGTVELLVPRSAGLRDLTLRATVQRVGAPATRSGEEIFPLTLDLDRSALPEQAGSVPPHLELTRARLFVRSRRALALILDPKLR